VISGLSAALFQAFGLIFLTNFLDPQVISKGAAEKIFTAKHY